MVGFLWTTFLFGLGLFVVFGLCLGKGADTSKLKNRINRDLFVVDSFFGTFLVYMFLIHMCLCGFWWVYPQSTNNLTRRRKRFIYKEARDYPTRVGLSIVMNPDRLDKRLLYDQL